MIFISSKDRICQTRQRKNSTQTENSFDKHISKNFIQERLPYFVPLILIVHYIFLEQHVPDFSVVTVGNYSVVCYLGKADLQRSFHGESSYSTMSN